MYKILLCLYITDINIILNTTEPYFTLSQKKDIIIYEGVIIFLLQEGKIQTT